MIHNGNRSRITGTSTLSVDDAIGRALSIASERYGEPDWFDVVTARGFISNGRVTHYQVTLKLGYEASHTPRTGTCSKDYYFQRACRNWTGGCAHTIETRF